MNTKTALAGTSHSTSKTKGFYISLNLSKANFNPRKSMTDTKAPIKTIAEIAEAIREIISVNDVKLNSKKARIIECAFIQGMMFSDDRYYVDSPYLTICLMSGRSILD